MFPLSSFLAIDTATGPCSVALWHDGKLASYLEDQRTVTQSVSLMPMVEKALAVAKLTYAQLGAVATTIGPGSFTGIRVGLAAARGIGFSAGIPTLGVTTLDVLAFAASKQAKAGENLLAILNAGKGEWYHARYTAQGSPLQEVQLGTLEAALNTSPAAAVFAGNAPITQADIRSSGVSFPRADLLAELLATHGEKAVKAPHPFYLRAPDAKPQFS
jgi:tRNA threonylcarbamoyl adenosine modification protein YeaZ